MTTIIAMRRSALATVLLSLAACGGTPEKPAEAASSTAGGVPLWVASPNDAVGPGAIAATECVLSSGAFSIDKGAATSAARLTMAQEISTRVAGLAESHASRVQTPEGIAVAQSFEATSKQLANETLQGAKISHLDYVTLQGQAHVCAMVVMDPAGAKSFFNNRVLAQAGGSLSQQDKDVLYEEFKAKQAQERLSNQ